MITKSILAASTVLGALALSAIAPASAADAMMKPAAEKCYGVAAAGKNDCAAGAHSCAGQATKNFDKSSFVELPKGACGKLAGGSLMAAK
jgi:uncharacterized membrane protein